MNYFEEQTLLVLKEYQPLKIHTRIMIEELKKCVDKDRVIHLHRAIKRNAAIVRHLDNIFEYMSDGEEILKGFYTIQKGNSRIPKEGFELNLYKLSKKKLRLLQRFSILLFGIYGFDCFKYDTYLTIYN